MKVSTLGFLLVVVCLVLAVFTALVNTTFLRLPLIVLMVLCAILNYHSAISLRQYGK